MAISYLWKISSLQVEYSSASLSDVVTSVGWSYSGNIASTSSLGISGSFGGNSSGRAGVVPASSASFVSYENLTEPLVIGWVTASLGDATITNIQTDISKSIAGQLNPIVGRKVKPWLPTGSL